MPELDVIGLNDAPNLEPLTIPVAGYKIDGTPVIEKFAFLPIQSAGATMDLLRHQRPDGSIPTAPMMTLLDACLTPEEGERWQTFLHNPEVMVEMDTLGEVYRQLMAYYAARPTRSPTTSPSTPSPPKPTSRGAANSRGSASRSSRSSKHST